MRKNNLKNGEVEERIGVFVCHCGTNIAGFIDVKRLIDYLSKIEGVVAVEEIHLCSDTGLQKIKDTIKNERLNKVVVATCTPRLHGELFKKVVEEAGINRGFLQIANIREQCSWVHWLDMEKATTKALDLIEMAISSVKNAVEVKKIRIPVERKVLVLGGGVAGITAALNLANSGLKVILAEKTGFLGGHMAKWDKVFPTLDCSICILGPLMSEVYNHPNIKVYTLCTLLDVEGAAGNYQVKLLRKARYVDESKCNGCDKCLEVCPVEVVNEYEYGLGKRKAIIKPFPEAVPVAPHIDIENCVGCRSCIGVCEEEAINFEDKDTIIEEKVGAIIVATGFQLTDPKKIEQYGYGRYLDVITGAEIERLVNPTGPTKGRLLRPSDGSKPKKICFIQCAGSRSQRLGKAYCSNVCCMYAMKQAMEIKSLHPEIDITIFYTDIRASGKGHEEAYLKTQSVGVRFIRGRVGRVVKVKDKLRVFFEDTLTCEAKFEDYDLVVLSVGIDVNSDNYELSRILRVPLDENGFFLEEHPKLRPADTFTKGIFIAGTAQGPKDITHSVAHAGLAALRAFSLLSSEELEFEVEAPTIDYEKCIGCGLCVRTCDYGALSRVDRKIIVNEVACMGCGACASVCPVEAIILPSITDRQIYSMLEVLLKHKREKPVIVGFLCKWCGYAAADMAGISRIPYPTNIRIIQVPCTARVSIFHILEAFRLGADGVLIIGCYENDCHYRTGFKKAAERVRKLKEVLRASGLNPERLQITSASAGEGEKLAKIITRFVEEIEEIGPLGAELLKVVKA